MPGMSKSRSWDYSRRRGRLSAKVPTSAGLLRDADVAARVKPMTQGEVAAHIAALLRAAPSQVLEAADGFGTSTDVGEWGRYHRRVGGILRELAGAARERPHS